MSRILRFDSPETYHTWLAGRGKMKKQVVTRLVPTEEEEQVSLIARARLHKSIYPPLAKLCHIKNQGTTWSHRERRRALAMGVVAGMPDLFLHYQARGYAGWFGEMKRIDEEPTHKQSAKIIELRGDGYFADVFYGQDAAWASLLWYIGEAEDGVDLRQKA